VKTTLKDNRLNEWTQPTFARWIVLLALFASLATIFVVRTALAQTGHPPRLFSIFNTIILLASLGALASGFRRLTRADWLTALTTGATLGALLTSSTFYPLFELSSPLLAAGAHGVALAVVLLAGLVIMRQGGPVRLSLPRGDWPGALKSIGFGIVLGLPFAFLNAFAFSQMQGGPFNWQNPIGSAVNALQPGIVEEVFFRLTFLGLIWQALRRVWPRQAVLIAFILSVVVHSYAHLDNLLRDQPLLALGYGAVLAFVFGAPMAYLAVRRNLETAAAFHWVIDAVRFMAGF
jgi:hypothetical protein